MFDYGAGKFKIDGNIGGHRTDMEKECHFFVHQ